MSQLDNDLDRDLARLVHDDPMPQGTPDTASLIRHGSRLRRRRQLAVTAGAGLAAAAVVAPFLLLGGGGEAVDLAPAEQPAASTSAATPTPTPTPTSTDSLKSLAELSSMPPQVCGVAVCRGNLGTTGSVEKGELIGTPLEMGAFDGTTEVLYAARKKGFDTVTGKPKDNVDVISAGIMVDGQLQRTVWAFQPVEEASLGPVFLYGAQRTLAEDGSPKFGMFGLIEGEHQEIVATVDGQSRPVAGLSTAVYPGYTAFYDTGAWDESWGGDQAEVTYGVPDGPSCSIAKCGMVG